MGAVVSMWRSNRASSVCAATARLGDELTTSAITRNAAMVMVRRVMTRRMNGRLANHLHLWLQSMHEDAKTQAEGDDLMLALGLGASHSSEMHELEVDTEALVQNTQNAAATMMRRAMTRLMSGELATCLDLWLQSMHEDAKLDAEGDHLMEVLGLGASHSSEMDEMEKATEALLQSKGVALLKQTMTRLMNDGLRMRVGVWRYHVKLSLDAQMREMYAGFKQNTTAMTHNAAMTMLRQAMGRLMSGSMGAVVSMWRSNRAWRVWNEAATTERELVKADPSLGMVESQRRITARAALCDARCLEPL